MLMILMRMELFSSWVLKEEQEFGKILICLAKLLLLLLQLPLEVLNALLVELL